MSTDSQSVNRGEVWLVSFDPAIGAEIRKTRPAVVLSSNEVGILPLKLMAPITEWNEAFAKNLWHVRIIPDSTNGLTKISAVDVLQVRGMDVRRFVTRLGMLSPVALEKITAALADIIEVPH